ncbi:hypothetical protein [Pseudooctadecabacter jejudonensis]|uniref:DNA methyltransferase n=1 Tax=Pseudooctadecabacter jejudonensis TaxID=1391910 RepID=A0A1Y5S0Q9_9RHOB|nr:hypothetical protein [Pseudooctadecabacter jejudonensis]SLN29685.1 hypothetical protein PSJ8397_01324 [Pseudooctadecabacter jejudonensis]
MEMILGLLIPALSGAAGGNITGKISETLNAGGMLNTVLGAVGGLGAGTILGQLGIDAPTGEAAAEAASNFDIGALIGAVGGGAAGGGVLASVVGVIKSAMNK